MTVAPPPCPAQTGRRPWAHTTRAGRPSRPTIIIGATPALPRHRRRASGGPTPGRGLRRWNTSGPSGTWRRPGGFKYTRPACLGPADCVARSWAPARTTGKSTPAWAACRFAWRVKWGPAEPKYIRGADARQTAALGSSGADNHCCACCSNNNERYNITRGAFRHSVSSSRRRGGAYVPSVSIANEHTHHRYRHRLRPKGDARRSRSGMVQGSRGGQGPGGPMLS